MAVECRFFVAEVSKTPAGRSGETGLVEAQGKVKLQASTKGPNNWSKWTPWGTFEMGTLNDAAMKWFDERLGMDVAIIIDDVPAEPGE